MRYYDPSIGRFMVTDRFADMYPSLTPYHYAANNPIKFIDVNGDSIKVSDIMLRNEALADYLASDEGRKYISQFAYEGQEITVAGQKFVFDKAGKYSTQNVNFMGVDKKKGRPHTIPINSEGGEYFVGKKGVQEYNIFIGSGSTISQADDIFHEVQHAFLYAVKGADGRGNFGSTDGSQGIHHRTMLMPVLYDPHRSFLNRIGADAEFKYRVVSSLMSQGGLGYTTKNYTKYIPEVQKIILNRRNFMKK